jgi:agmatinase
VALGEPYLGRGEAEERFEHARVAILPVPYEATVCWKRGTALAPRAVIDASPHLEFYDEQLESEPYRCGVWTDRELPIPDGPPERLIESVTRRFGELMDAGKWVVMLGGEHSITPGGVRAAAQRHPGLQLVQLDAHADLRESFDGDPWSHASAMARCVDLAPIRALGIRSYTAEEARRIRRGIPGYRMVHAWEMRGDAWMDRMLDGLDGRPVYLTFDVDYFDPSVMPATGTPEPGGGDWYGTLEFLTRLFARADVVACDVVELSPTPGLHHADFTVARLIYKLIGMRFPG